jgi:hypothetical protein
LRDGILYQQKPFGNIKHSKLKKMKKSTLQISLILVFFSFCFSSFSQDVNTRKFNPDQPIFFSPKSHDPNFLKSGKLSEKSFYQSKSEWQHIIDTTWGPGDSLSRKLEIFNAYAQKIHDESDVLCFLNMNWDSLYNHYLNQINESTSKGAFSSIMSHFAYDMKDLHTKALDISVQSTPLNPGIPALLIGSYISVEHFGAVTTVLPDSTTLVLRVVPNHPLNLEPGDIILGYEGVPWKKLVGELLDGGLPMMATTGGCKSTDIYENLSGGGLNWHLFSTIDILKYSTGDTLHLSVLPILNLSTPQRVNNEQMAIPNIPFPKFNFGEPVVSDTVVTYGILENTNIGYIFLIRELPTSNADEQFYHAVNALKNTDALIIDMRYNYGGRAFFDEAFEILFNEFHKTVDHAVRCNPTTFDLCPNLDWVDLQIDGKKPDYYDRPIAVLLGPTCVSMGDITAQRLRYHPMVKFFGASSAASLGFATFIENIPDWLLGYSGADMFHVSSPGVYLSRREFPIDYPVWFNKDDVAKGIDPIVEKSLEWINNLAYGHSVTTDKMVYSAGKDTIKTSAIIENPNLHELSARLIFESLDGTVTDSTDTAELNLTGEAKWQAKWKTYDLPENMYWISLKVTDKTDGTTFTNKHVTRITTVPVELSKITFNKISAGNYKVQPGFKNSGKSKVLTNLTIDVTSNDPWIKSISPDSTTLSFLKPGQPRNTESFTLSFDAATFPGYFNLTFNISTDNWTYWVLNTDSLSTGIKPLESIPLALNLEQNYPNPFNLITTINWQLAQNSKVTLKVLDIVGRTVATLVDDQRPQGKYETQFNAATLPQGIYFCQLRAGELMQTRKMILLE